jgi:NADH-quinone oxidoreductase subunit G
MIGFFPVREAEPEINPEYNPQPLETLTFVELPMKGVQLMRVITVCVGSACHLKGSHDIINYFKNAIKDARLDGEVELKGTFCMDKCTEGVNILIDEDLFHASSVDDAHHIFQTEILQKRK